MTDGLVVADKPSGCTSHDVVARLRRAYGQKRVGHAGTLDPGATGVLVVGLGRATRLLRFLTDTGKVYRGRIVLGIATDTLDADGTEIAREPMSVDRAMVEEATGKLTGDILQVPPMVSALKVEGRRLHDLARRGVEVERAPRAVRVLRFDVLQLTPGDFPEVIVEVECSSGTYVRCLAADLGAALGGVAHLSELRRTRVGDFDLDDARTLEEIEREPGAAVLPPTAAVRHLPRSEVPPDLAAAISHGRKLPADALRTGSGGPVALCDSGGVLLAVYERHGAVFKPMVVMVDEAAG